MPKVWLKTLYATPLLANNCKNVLSYKRNVNIVYTDTQNVATVNRKMTETAEQAKSKKLDSLVQDKIKKTMKRKRGAEMNAVFCFHLT